MRKIEWKRTALGILVGALLTASLSACGNEAKGSQESTAEAATDSGAETIKVGTGMGYPPMWYEDEDGNLTGFEVELLKAIDEELPQYQFEYETSSDITGALISLDAQKVRLVAFALSRTPEREEKYLFGDEGYFYNRIYVGALEERDDLNTLEDLHGKKVGVIQGDSFTTALEEYNETHQGGEIDLEYITWGTDEENLSLLTSGRLDGLSNMTQNTVDGWNEAYGNGEPVVKLVGDPVIESASYIAFGKQDTELKEAVDGAIRGLKEKGTLSELSIEFFGSDYSK